LRTDRNSGSALHTALSLPRCTVLMCIHWRFDLSVVGYFLFTWTSVRFLLRTVFFLALGFLRFYCSRVRAQSSCFIFAMIFVADSAIITYSYIIAFLAHCITHYYRNCIVIIHFGQLVPSSTIFLDLKQIALSLPLCLSVQLYYRVG